MCALRTKGGTRARARGEYKNLMDLKKKQKKKQNAFGVQHTHWYKRVSSVTQSSRYRSIYIDWQRSYDE
jgi:hypothetical protein